MTFAAFKDSAVTRIDSQQLLEEATILPDHLFPVYLGNGHLGLNLDASGLQTLDSQRLQGWWAGKGDGNYLFGHGMLSSHLAWTNKTYDFDYNLMPTGYLDWEMRYGDSVVNRDTLRAKAHVWQRTVALDGSCVETSMLLDMALRLTIRIFIPFASTKIVMCFTAKAYQERNQSIEPPLPFTLTARMNLGLRDGTAIFESVQQEADSVLLRHHGYEDYRLRYRWSANCPVDLEQSATAYSIVWQGETGDAAATLQCCLDVKAPELAEAIDFSALAVAHQADWSAFWAHSAAVVTGDTRKDFLYANSLHFLRCAHEYGKGGLGASLASHPECWMGCNFWDMQWVCDGLLRANNSALVVEFITYLKRVMRPAGRPFPWMMTYDGRTPVKPEDDQGVVVIDAFATIAIRAYLDTRDEALFTECVWPICDRVCAFLVAEMYTQEGDHYILGTPVAHDVGGMGEALINETYTNVWSTSVLKRALQLARDHHLHPDWAATAAEIVAHPFFESDEEYYQHARGVAIKDFSFASWVPNLLYPTELHGLLDMARFNATREAASFVELYMEKQGDYQPWSYFWTALTDFRRGAVVAAEWHIQEGMALTHGAGYFCECGPFQWGSCGLPPYPAPHGAFLTAISEQFFAGSYWDNTLTLATNFPESWRQQSVHCRHIRSGNGCLLHDFRCAPQQLAAHISGQGRYRLTTLLPSGLTRDTARIEVDGQPCAVNYPPETHRVEFDIELSEKPCSITISPPPEGGGEQGQAR